VIIIAVGIWGRPPIASRAVNLQDNVGLVMDLVRPLHAQSPSAFWIVVTTPVDALVHLIHKVFTIPRQKIIGLNRNDTSRLRWAIGKVMSVPATDVEAYVLGEHGDTQVHLFSRVNIRGQRTTLDGRQKDEVRKKIVSFLVEWNQLQPGRTAGWNSAESLGDMVRSLATSDGRIWACSTPLEGEYGLRDVSLGVPVKLGASGVKEIVQFEIDADEKSGVEASAKAIREQIKRGEALLVEYAGIQNQMTASLRSAGKS